MFTRSFVESLNRAQGERTRRSPSPEPPEISRGESSCARGSDGSISRLTSFSSSSRRASSPQSPASCSPNKRETAWPRTIPISSPGCARSRRSCRSARGSSASRALPSESLLGALREYLRRLRGGELARRTSSGRSRRKRARSSSSSRGLLQEERARQFVRAGYDFDNLTHAWKAAKLGREERADAVRPRSPAASRADGRGEGRGAFFPRTSRRMSRCSTRRYEETKSLAACAVRGGGREMALPLRGRAGRRSALLSQLQGRPRQYQELHPAPQIRRSARRRSMRSGSRGAISRRRGSGASPRGRRGALLVPRDERLTRGSFASVSPGTALWKIDPIMRQALMEFLGESRYRFFDFSPVLYHIELRERDFELVRRIVVGRINRLSEDSDARARERALAVVTERELAAWRRTSRSSGVRIRSNTFAFSAARRTRRKTAFSRRSSSTRWSSADSRSSSSPRRSFTEYKKLISRRTLRMFPVVTIIPDVRGAVWTKDGPVSSGVAFEELRHGGREGGGPGYIREMTDRYRA